MRRFTPFILFAAITLLPGPGFSCTPEDVAALGPKRLPLNAALSLAEKNLLARYDFIRRVKFRREPAGPGETDLICEVVVDGVTEKIAQLRYKVEGSRLAYSVWVSKEARELGFSRALLITALEDHPKVNALPTELVGLNAANFILPLVAPVEPRNVSELTHRYVDRVGFRRDSDRAFAKLCRETQTPQDLIRLRDRMLEIYTSKTPAGRLGKSLGFSEIGSIAVTFTRKDGELDVTIGVLERKPSDTASGPPRLLISDETQRRPSYRELAPDGAVRVLPEKPPTP